MQTFIQGFRNLPFKNYIYTIGGITLLTMLVVVAFSSFLPPQVPLFYGKPVGEGQLTSTFGLTIAPLTAILILIINSIVAMFTENTFIKKILIVGGFVSCLLAIITVLRIIFLVGFF